MSYIRYKNNNLFVENVSVKSLASKLNTPFYLYSENQIKENYIKFSNTFRKTNPLICFLKIQFLILTLSNNLASINFDTFYI